jgi:hypothetical protein
MMIPSFASFSFVHVHFMIGCHIGLCVIDSWFEWSTHVDLQHLLVVLSNHSQLQYYHLQYYLLETIIWQLYGDFVSFLIVCLFSIMGTFFLFINLKGTFLFPWRIRF